ncbi:MAG: hypothetical protein ACI4YA_04155 [Candidatus Spyradenecus sp.]
MSGNQSRSRWALGLLAVGIVGVEVALCCSKTLLFGWLGTAVMVSVLPLLMLFKHFGVGDGLRVLELGMWLLALGAAWGLICTLVRRFTGRPWRLYAAITLLLWHAAFSVYTAIILISASI